jgi:hypothetical protein
MPHCQTQDTGEFYLEVKALDADNVHKKNIYHVVRDNNLRFLCLSTLATPLTTIVVNDAYQ